MLKFTTLLLSAILIATLSNPVVAATFDALEEQDPLAGIFDFSRDDASEALQQIRRGRPDEALAILERFGSDVESSTELLELRGLAQGQIGNIEASLADFDASIEINPNRSTAHLHRAIVLLAIAQFDAARASLEKTVELDPKERRAYQRLGLLDEAEGDVNGAIANFKLGIEGLPAEIVSVRENLAQLYLQLNQPEQALDTLAHWRAKPDAPAAVALLLGDAELRLGKQNAAREIWQNSISHNPTPLAYIRLANLSKLTGDLAQSEATLRTAYDAFPENPRVLFSLGNIIAAQARYTEALSIYDEGLSSNPEDASLLRAASRAAWRLDDLENARAFAMQLTKTELVTSGDWVWSAFLAESQDDIDGARSAYDAALAINPDDWLALNNLAALVVDHDPEQAVELAGKSARLMPENTSVQDTLGWAKFKSGDLLGARQIFTKLSEQNPTEAEIAFRLGVILFELDELNGARSALEKALELDANSAEAQEARDILSKL